LHAVTTYGGAEVHLYLFLSSTADGGVWLQFGRSTRGEGSACTRYVGGLVGLHIDVLEKRKIMSKYLQR